MVTTVLIEQALKHVKNERTILQICDYNTCTKSSLNAKNQPFYISLYMFSHSFRNPLLHHSITQENFTINFTCLECLLVLLQ